MSDRNITCTITKPVAVLSETGKGYTREVNFISWNGNDSKLDIRDWAPDHERIFGSSIPFNASVTSLMAS